MTVSPSTTRLHRRPAPARHLPLIAVALVLTACGGYGNKQSTPPAPPVVTLAIAPESVLVGEATTLTWSADGGAGCVASDAWSGAEPLSGTQSFTPSSAGTLRFTLTCSTAATAGYTGAPVSTIKTVTLNVVTPSAFSQTPLVQDTAGGARVDARLSNSWGLAFGATSPAWIANNGSSLATLFDGRGVSPTLVVALPRAADGTSFGVTGVVANGTGAFAISNGSGGPTASAAFLFAGESGRIAGWAPTVDRANAITAFTAPDGAVYRGLAVARDGDRPLLYATDFHNAKVDVLDTAFQKQSGFDDFPFFDPALPTGYAPFGIAALPIGERGAVQIVVTYAKRSAADEDVPGDGLGVVDVFDTRGRLLRTLVGAGGALNAPWGLALAPADFGTFANALLVGNFGDGRIHAYDATSGRSLGALGDASGRALAIDGLWGLAFGNDFSNQPHATLFFTAGPNDEQNGAFGRLDLGAVAPTLHAPPAVALSAPAAGTVSGTVSVTADVVASASIAGIEFFANGAAIGTARQAPFTVAWDTTKTANGGVTLTARATDVDGNVDTSPRVAVTVANAVASAASASVLPPAS